MLRNRLDKRNPNSRHKVTRLRVIPSRTRPLPRRAMNGIRMFKVKETRISRNDLCKILVNRRPMMG